MRVPGMLCLIAVAFWLAPATAQDKGKLDPAKIIGSWSYASGEKDGKKIPADDLKKGYVEITKDTLMLKSPDATFVLKYKLNTEKTPAQIDMEITEGPQGVGAKSAGIIGFKGDQLQLCYPAMGEERPTAFATKEGSGLHLFVLTKKK
jgi:uncharacterized protein (TIGR03067 family)